MGVFLGYIEKKNYEPTIYFNFKPIAELKDSTLVVLSPEDQSELLPDSDKRDINFSYIFSNAEHRKQMDQLFNEKTLIIFDFTLDDLQPNLKNNGERFHTGYKVQAIDMINEGRICPIDTCGIFHIIEKEELLSDFYNDSIVDIEAPSILPGETVFVDLDGFLAGPYTVRYREYTSSLYIKPQIKENKYTINGYQKGNYMIQQLIASSGYWAAPEYIWKVMILNQDALKEQLDVISNEILIESFRDNLANGKTNNGQVQISDIPALLERYKTSVLSGTLISENISNDRLSRLSAILTTEADVDKTLSTVTDFICDMLVKHKDSPNVEKWLQTLLIKRPEFVEQLKDSRTITEKISQLEQHLEELQQQRIILEKEIEAKKQTAQSIDQAAIEAKKIALLEMDVEYADLSDKIESAKKVLGITSDIAGLQKKQRDLQHEVDYLNSHKRHLEADTGSLEIQFQELISKPHEKMVGIAFDGFMASKMLNAAAQWESEQATQNHENLVNIVNSVETYEKNPDELIDYLYRTIQIIRPSYSRNTIINIAICLTQSFLTIFSGEPGCGKTSICNIFGEVLGLNKFTDYLNCPDTEKDSMKRFISVSVERGWTSKRDFVGYFNPLSKTFDKSNRRVYDALHQLDAEKRKGACKLPYVILLDEANLSPMEYYWSDFMNICDDIGAHSKVNLGEDYIFDIPDTLHFLATINNDHTTETISPRLIDRAWIVSLPQQYGSLSVGGELPKNEIEIITWETLSKAFIPTKEECVLSADVQKIYDAVLAKLKDKHIYVSPRIDIAIKRFWAVAAKCFNMDETGTDAATVALDYAVAQRILPKINGNGEPFEKWLEELRSLCSANGLNMSTKIIRDIIDRGNQQMKYYQFFC